MNRHRSDRVIRLVFLIRNLGIGGAESQLCILAKHLDPSRFKIAVVCFYGGGDLERELTDANVRVVSVAKRGRWDVLRFLMRLAKELRKLKPDILFPYLTEQNVIAIMMKPILPSTKIVWGVRASNMNAGLHEWLSNLLFRLEVVLSRFANLIIFNSFSGEKCALSVGFSAAPRAVIPNGVELFLFSPNQKLRIATRESWSIPEKALVIGLVGRLDPMKDHANFLKAAAIFATQYQDARFVCIGDGRANYASRLARLSEDLGLGSKVIQLFKCTDMPAVYNAFDICCSSSAFGEGTPNCIVEAMACGVPCVVTDVGDSSRIVGNTGIVVPPSNPSSLAAGLSDMAERIRRTSEIGRVSRRRAELLFNVRAMVTETSEALLNLM